MPTVFIPLDYRNYQIKCGECGNLLALLSITPNSELQSTSISMACKVCDTMFHSAGKRGFFIIDSTEVCRLKLKNGQLQQKITELQNKLLKVGQNHD